MFSFLPPRQAAPAGARNWRAYVVGDVHGRLDLLNELLARIEAEVDEQQPERVLLAFVGDLIDRGPSSAQVIERLRGYERERVRTQFLLGNHEEVLLRILHGNADLIEKWCRFGGMECLESYGVKRAQLRSRSPRQALEIVREAIPPEHVSFLESFDDSCRFGDYLFVHAGIRPGVEIAGQQQNDLRWIREPFLNDETDHGVVVVHGHTICAQVEVRPNRIGIDTGAYRTGVLTALAIDGSRTWYLNTRSTSDEQVALAH